MASFETETKKTSIWLKNNRKVQANYNSCKNVFRMVQTTGIKVNLFGDVKLGILRKVYLFLVLLICIYACGFALWYRFVKEAASVNINAYGMTDQLVQMTIIYIIFHRYPINEITCEIWQIGHRQCPNLKVKFWARFSLFLTIPPLLSVLAMSIRGFLTVFIDSGMSSTTGRLILVEYIYLGVPLPLVKLCSNAFVSYFLLHTSILKQCFESLNKSLNPNEGNLKTKLHFLRKHQQLSELAHRFNAIFSPAITVGVAIRMLQIVIEVNYFFASSLSQLKLRIPLTIFHLLTAIQTLVGFLAMVYVGQQMKNHSQKGIDVLLDFIVNNTIQEVVGNDEEDNCKMCQITTLASAKNTICPTEVTASNLFSIDYSVILAIVSITFAFISIIPPDIN